MSNNDHHPLIKLQSIPLSGAGSSLFAHVSKAKATTRPARPSRKPEQPNAQSSTGAAPAELAAGWFASELVTLPTVLDRLKLSRSQIYALMARGEFPKPLKIGRSARWSSQELEVWVEAKLSARPSASELLGGAL